MPELYYCGFNGYRQCPEGQGSVPKIVNNFISILNEEFDDVQCTHKSTVIRNQRMFKIYGFLNEGDAYSAKIHSPVVDPDAFVCAEDFLVFSKDLQFWKFYNDNWAQMTTVSTSEIELWSGKALKLNIHANQDIVILLENNSVWKLTKNEELKLVYAPELDKAIDISSGFEHSLILTESGCVLSFGGGSRGQLGDGDLNPSEEPIQITALAGCKIIKIAAGGWHSCAISDSDALYSWGWNNFGQLSHPGVGLSATPLLVDFDLDVDVRDVACGSRHSVVRMGNNRLYSTGWNGFGQLGIGKSITQVNTYTEIKTGGVPGKLLAGSWSSLIVAACGS